MMGNTSFAVATTAHSKATVAGTEVGVGVGGSIPEKRKRVGQVGSEGQGIDTCIRLGSGANRQNEVVCPNDNAASQSHTPVVVGGTAMNFSIVLYFSLSGKDDTSSTCLSCKVSQQGKRLDTSF